MDKGTINQRVVKAISYLLDQGIVKKKGDIADVLQCSPQTITEILGGRQGMKVDILQKFFDKFRVSYEYIFEGTGHILKEESRNAQEYAQKYAQESSSSSLNQRKSKSTTFEKSKNEVPLFLPASGKTTSTNIVVLPVPVADESEMVAIPVVDISVAAGSGFYNPDQLSEIDCIRMPRSMVKGGQPHLCVRIKGESMVPTLQDGGYLIIRLLDRCEWEDIRDGHVYVVSEVAGRAFVKRLKNRLAEHGFIVCMSDSADVQRYPNFNLMEDELNTIWHAEWYMSAKMPNIHATYYNKVSELEDKYDDLKLSFETELKLLRKEVRALGK